MIGSNQTLFTLTLDSSNKSGDQMELAMAQYLRDRGYAVTAPNQVWEKRADFCRRLKISHSHFRRCLTTPHRPDVLVYPSLVRVQEILSNQQFDAFVLRNKK